MIAILPILLIQILIFLALIIVFRRILSKNVVSATRHLDEVNQDYNKKEEQINNRFKKAQEEAENLLFKARQEAQTLKEQTIKELAAEKDEILSQARIKSEEIMQQADNSRKALLDSLEERIKKESVSRACELIQVTLPEEFKRDVHTHWVNDLLARGFDKIERLRIPKDIKQVAVTSAFSLSDVQRKNLVKKLKNLLKRDVSLKEQIDPKVVAGVVVKAGDLVLDGSLKNRIKEHANRI